jgi:CBS domain containing-hemolysin-like protein
MIGMILLCLIVLALLVAVAGVRPVTSDMSGFELKRRKQNGDKRAKASLRRRELFADIVSLQRVLEALFVVIFTSLSIVTFGWFFGIMIAVVIALEYGALARMSLWRRRVQKLYEQYEDYVLRFVEKAPWLFALFRSVSPEKSDLRLDSRDELVHLVAESGALLSSNEKKIISHSLRFEDRKVSEVMTPRTMIDSINRSEMLGPLVLDDLHKTGHSRFPVVAGDIDHVIGMLYIQDLLTLDKKRSQTAEKAMSPKVFYIREDHQLSQALAAFLRTRHHLFVVVNQYRETVGLISLEDVLEALLGRKIIDEFDAHEDLRAVAERNPRANNMPKNAKIRSYDNR